MSQTLLLQPSLNVSSPCTVTPNVPDKNPPTLLAADYSNNPESFPLTWMNDSRPIIVDDTVRSYISSPSTKAKKPADTSILSDSADSSVPLGTLNWSPYSFIRLIGHFSRHLDICIKSSKAISLIKLSTFQGTFTFPGFARDQITLSAK